MQHTTSLLHSCILVFAYGATGAGKTYTMVGDAGQPGVIVQTVTELYERIDAMRDDVQCDLTVSYLEIYNEEVRDLFAPATGALFMREDGEHALTVANLSVHQVRTDRNLSLLRLKQFAQAVMLGHSQDNFRRQNMRISLASVSPKPQPKPKSRYGHQKLSSYPVESYPMSDLTSGR